jgi:hypothetical protein
MHRFYRNAFGLQMPDPELLRDWHPLDHTPAPEYVPPTWNGSHVGKRLAKALRTLRHMPINGYPAGFTNSWPAVLHEYSDRAGYEDDPVWKAERAAESNWTKSRTSPMEIARMETAVVWPAHSRSRPATASHGAGRGPRARS